MLCSSDALSHITTSAIQIVMKAKTLKLLVDRVVGTRELRVLVFTVLSIYSSIWDDRQQAIRDHTSLIEASNPNCRP